MEDTQTYENHPQDARVKSSDAAPTLGTYGNAQEGKDVLVKTVAVDFGGGKSNVNVSDEQSPTLCTTHAGEPVVFPIEGNGARPSHLGKGYGTSDDPQFTLNHTEVHGVANRQAVRRITPVEAERLMGFPSSWTKIPWKGKPADECPDGPRYKACGNSMCVNCMEWIGMRIMEVERIAKGEAK